MPWPSWWEEGRGFLVVVEERKKEEGSGGDALELRLLLVVHGGDDVSKHNQKDITYGVVAIAPWPPFSHTVVVLYNTMNKNKKCEIVVVFFLKNNDKYNAY